MSAAQTISGSEAATDPYRGLYINREQVEQALAREPGSPILKTTAPDAGLDKQSVNGLGFRAIERATGVNHNTVINWVKQVGTSEPEAPEISEIPEISQIDELETFVAKKKQDLAVDSGK